MTSAPTKLVETGVAYLDRILGGGLLQRSVAMIIGAPGTGKTILSLQIVFHNASRGARVLYLTGYSETHDKLLAHSLGLTFVTPGLVGKEIQLASLPDLLRAGVEETVAAIIATVRAQKATLVVLDGFRSIRGFMSNDQEAARFLYSLGAELALMGATTLVVVEGDAEETSHFPELTVCDAIIVLRRERTYSRERRLLEVLKVRGATPLEGAHPFTLNQAGLTIFPRFETMASRTEPAWKPGRAAMGIPALDALIGGGLNAATATLAAGSPGVGKTLLGLHFLAEGVRLKEPVLFLGFMESPAQLREKARIFGMDLDAAEASGQLRFLVLRGHDLEADEIARTLSEDIERRGVRRLVIDSAAEVQRSVGFQGHVPDFLSALVSYLRVKEVTSYLTLDLPVSSASEFAFADTMLSSFAESLLLLRQIEYLGRLHSVLSIMKMRFSDHERATYELTIKPDVGFQIIGPAPVGEGLLTGVQRVTVPPDQHDQRTETRP